MDRADGYSIQRSSNDGGPYTELANAISATTYVDSSVSHDETWHYTVAAHGLAGPGEASAVVSDALQTRCFYRIVVVP